MAETGFGNQIKRAFDDLMEIDRQVPKVLPEAVDDGAKMLLSLARQNVPVRYGDLKESGMVEADTKESSATKAASRVAFKAFYARFQEYGTTRHPAQSFLRPAADRAEPLIQRHIERKVQAVIDRIKSR
jgi:HK97 gp10 family phage protein